MIIQWSFVLFMLAIKSASSNVLNEGPCNFLDTVNITEGWKDINGDFHYKEIIFRFGTYAEYSYIFENNTEKVPVEPHFRGCICKYKPCVRICCKPSDDENKKNCLISDTLLNIPIEDGEEKNISIYTDEFGVLFGKPCVEMYKLEPLDYEYDKWLLLKVSFCIFFYYCFRIKSD